MANTFKVVTFAAEPASAGTAYKMYTCAGSTTTVVLGLILTNIHSSAVTAEVELVSDTGSRGGANNVSNGTSFLIKDVSIPAGSSLELLSGGKVVLETTDELKIDCSVADKLSGTLYDLDKLMISISTLPPSLSMLFPLFSCSISLSRSTSFL